MRASRVEGKVALASLLRGPTRLADLRIQGDLLELFGFRFEGDLRASAQNATLGNEADLQSAMLELRHGSVRNGTLELHVAKGLTIALRAESSAIRATLLAEEITAISGGEHSALARGLSIMSRFPSTAATAANAAAARDVTVGFDHLEWPALNLNLRALSCTLALLDVNSSGRRVELGNGELTTSVLVEDEPIHAKLRVNKLAITPSELAFDGKLTAEGADALVIFELLRLPESLALTFSGLKGAAFGLGAGLEYRSGRLKIEQMRVRADGFSLAGALAIDEGGQQGKLGLDYRGIRLGVRLAKDERDVVFNPQPGWLDGALLSEAQGHE